MLLKLPGNRDFGAPFPNLTQPGRVLLVGVVVDHLDFDYFVRFCMVLNAFVCFETSWIANFFGGTDGQGASFSGRIEEEITFLTM